VKDHDGADRLGILEPSFRSMRGSRSNSATSAPRPASILVTPHHPTYSAANPEVRPRHTAVRKPRSNVSIRSLGLW
jgi:hypothetical protein